jgi:tetratricopeptide (TPR) repeat protein
VKVLDPTSSLGGVSRGGVSLVLLAVLALGCSELQARRHARAGNAAYLDGDYANAVREYEAAESKSPLLPVVALNKGLACRRMMVPGSHSPEQQDVSDCALAAFTRLKTLSPDDPRGEQLFIQTLFDAERFDALVSTYEAELREDPKNLAALNGLIQVHGRLDHWLEVLRWTTKRADIGTEDAEAQLAVGAVVCQYLLAKGGRDKATFDPRPDPHLDPQLRSPAKDPPPFTVGDVVGTERVRLADVGLSYLRRALRLQPRHRSAMTYMGLLYLQRSFGLFDKPVEWTESVDEARRWQQRSLDPSPQAGQILL